MDPNQEKDNSEYTFELADDEVIDEPGSVDDFMRELEAKEKDLHITLETTFIELAEAFEEEDEVPDLIRPELPSVEKQAAPAPARAARPAAPADDMRVRQLEAEVAALKSKISGLEDERGELFQNSQRRLKDFESFKARTERERSETFQRQLSNLATQMLPALDNLDRALQCASEMCDEKQTEFAQFFDGIVLVNQQVHEVLAGMGIVPIPAVGTEFDPHFHEAVAIDEESDEPENTITAELLRGFRIGDKIIRHSMVKVAKGNAGPKAPDAGEVISLEPVETPGDTRAGRKFVIERNGTVFD